MCTFNVNTVMDKKIYYYYHSESDAVWSSHREPVLEIGWHGIDIDEVDKERAEELAEEMGMESIPFN